LYLPVGAEIWRWREAPTHHGELSLTVQGHVDNGRHCVGKDTRQDWEVARQIALDSEEAPNDSWLRVML